MNEKDGNGRGVSTPGRPWIRNLKSSIDARTARLGVVGLGYVGLPLAILFARQFRVCGLDVNRELVRNLLAGKSHIDDISDPMLHSVVGKTFFPTDDGGELRLCDFIIVTVPTPLRASLEPDLGPIQRAGDIIAKNLRSGQFVILESTTYPGTTRDVLTPILERSGLSAGVDFGVAYSPERVDPGNGKYRTENTPKVVGGINMSCTQLAAQLFESVVDRVVKVRSCEVAEASKMLENVFRAVNIALVNEMALVLDRMNINTWDVIDAASTKPYGFMPFYPGPGIGGHCIPLDPFYMSYRAKQVGVIARFIELSGEINDFMKIHLANLTTKTLERTGKHARGATVAVLGFSYKKDIRDTRESPAIKIIEELTSRGCVVRGYDPIAERIQTQLGLLESASSVEEVVRGADAVVLVTDHSDFRHLDFAKLIKLMNPDPVLVDGRNIVQKIPEGCFYVGIGKGEQVPAGYRANAQSRRRRDGSDRD